VNSLCISYRQIENIFKMLIWHNNYIPVVVRPLMRTDESSNGIIMINNIALNGKNVLVLDSPDQKAKRTYIVFGSMTIHGRLIYGYYTIGAGAPGKLRRTCKVRRK